MNPRFFDKPTPWSPSTAEPNHYISWAFTAGAGTQWNQTVGHTIPTPPSPAFVPNEDAETTQQSSSEIPANVFFVSGWDDDVSLLNDDPDDDDDQMLPPSTYDVLAPLLDEMYKDDSEVNDTGGNSLDIINGADWDEREVMADNARAA